MKKRYISTRFTVSQTPREVFAAINDVSAWWTGKITGSAMKLGDEFTYRYGDMHTSKQRVTTFLPGKKIVWLVVSAKLNFVANKKEWNGTEITFDIAKKGDKTELRFTHVGLDSDQECFEDCSSAWGTLIKGNLKKLIAP
jgi:Activator of Hsp90 ATPase homolog 1-like protein